MEVKMNRMKPMNVATMLTVLMSALLIFGAAPISAGDKHSHAEAPMQVVTEGLTARQHLEQQAELSRRLLDELPQAAAESAIRIPLTAAEVSAIDHAITRSEVPLQIGIVKAMAPGIKVHGLTRGSVDSKPTHGKSSLAVPTREGGFAWANVVISEKAGAIRLHVEDMSLPSNVELYFYSRNGQAHGPYTGTGPNDTGEFWTATIFGSEAILQLCAAANVDVGGISLRVVEAGLITPKFAGSLQVSPKAPPAPGFCGNPNCVVDASCYGGIADSLALAVAKMEWIQGAYIYTCTGGLIKDNNPSQNNFFLTANHCVSKSNNAKNLNLYWRFATSSCNGSCPGNNGWPYQTSGATVSKTGRKGDYSLLHLNTGPPAGSVFLGWTNTPVANNNGTGLYRVSNPNFGPQVYSEHSVDTSAPTCSSWPRGERIYSRDTLGAIDGGSSGSPIVNSSGQIVGQLSGTCGLNPSNPCSGGPGEDNATVDGAFAFYYASVQPILNP
jgi:V8-like Glu-specific endopeptidase